MRRQLFSAVTPTSQKHAVMAAMAVIAFTLSTLTLAANSPGESAEIAWFQLTMGLLGGLAMFLFGMEQMSDGLKAAAGETLKDILNRLTKNRFMGALTGAFVTAVLNSSSVTTVLVVGFIAAGFMSLAQSVGVIMGANIGSTFTAQIVAFNVTQYALAMVAVGFLMLFTAGREKTRHYGSMIMGLGLVFYGMGVMGDAMTPLRSYQPFLELMIRMENPALGILVGAIFTGLVQSSAATTGIAIVMAAEGLISLPAGIALAFGSNIGTCVTAVLASLGKPVEAVRAALVHILFNVAGVLLWVFFIPQLAELVTAISPSSPELAGKARMAAEVPRQIANAHTVFNLANTLIFISFTSYFARLVEWLVPDKPLSEKTIVEPRFLDREIVRIPGMALEQARFEIGHMGEIIDQMFRRLREAVDEGDRDGCVSVQKMDDQVDILHDAILDYLSEIRQEPLTDRQSEVFQSLMSATINLENLADVIESELVEVAIEFIERGDEPDETTLLLVESLADQIQQSIIDCVRAVRESDERAAAEVISLKTGVGHLAAQFLDHQSRRIGADDPRRLPLVRLELGLLEKLRRIYTLSKRVAKEMVPSEVANKA